LRHLLELIYLLPISFLSDTGKKESSDFLITSSLSLREEHRLRVLRRIFGPKRGEVTGGWIKLHNEELHNLYSSPSIIRIIKSSRTRWAGHVA
jgi:hypothetical protein